MTAGGKIKHKTRLFDAVRDRDGMVCHWCDCAVRRVPSLWGGRLAPDHATLDHVTPRSAGGRDEVSNLVMCCFSCNQARARQSGTAGPITEADLIALMTNPDF